MVKITGVVLTRQSDNYYGKPPFIEQVVFRYYPTSADGVGCLSTGGCALGKPDHIGCVECGAGRAKPVQFIQAACPRWVCVMFNIEQS